MGNTKNFKKLYSERHQKWWHAQDADPVLRWQPPVVARSQHIGLRDKLNEIRQFQQKAAQESCRGLVNLDYQPLCSCGFNGESGPTATLLVECGKLQREIDVKLRSFFQQDRIKEAISSWQDTADTVQGDFADYLSGGLEIPKIKDLTWFDGRLSGDAMYSDVDASGIITLLAERDWEPETPQKALDQYPNQYPGQYLRFVNCRQNSKMSDELIACLTG